MASAFGLGQPSRGFTSRKSDKPKFAIARAQAPIFSPNCGSERMMAGAGCESDMATLPLTGLASIAKRPRFPLSKDEFHGQNQGRESGGRARRGRDDARDL